MIGNRENTNHAISVMSAASGPEPNRFCPGSSSRAAAFAMSGLRSGSSALRLSEHAHQVARGDEHDDPEQQHVRAAAGVVEVDDRVLERADLKRAGGHAGAAGGEDVDVVEHLEVVHEPED